MSGESPELCFAPAWCWCAKCVAGGGAATDKKKKGV
jgi:hypothetical protein